MRHIKALLALTILLLLGITSATWLVAQQFNKTHLQDQACESCHLGGANSTSENAHMLIGSQERLCGRCHPGALTTSHPSGFVPKQAVSADYPLDWKGELTCSSCHQVHGSGRGLMRGTRRGRPLCLSCHNESFFAKMRDQGISVMTSGHLDASTNQSEYTELDNISRLCMECHDKSGDGRPTDIGRQLVLRHGSKGINHPISVKYADAERFGGYRPAAMLSKGILLPGGMVSCVSCHEGYTAKHGKLVAPRAGSALCMECHNL